MREDCGSSLVECTVAIGLLTSGLVALAHLTAIAVHVNAEAKYRTLATIVATQKVEEIRAAPALEDVAQAVEYLSGDGEILCEEDLPCAGAVYVRRWSIGPVASAPGSVWIEVSARHARRAVGEVHLVTMRARNAQ